MNDYLARHTNTAAAARARAGLAGAAATDLPRVLDALTATVDEVGIEQIIDLIADLLHLASLSGVAPAAILERAVRHFRAEAYDQDQEARDMLAAVRTLIAVGLDPCATPRPDPAEATGTTVHRTSDDPAVTIPAPPPSADRAPDSDEPGQRAHSRAQIAVAQQKFAPVLAALSALGLDARLDVTSSLDTIRLGLGIVRGEAAYLLVTDDMDKSGQQQWWAGVYAECDDGPLEIFCARSSAVAAVQLVLQLLADPVRVAAYHPRSDTWRFAVLPLEALGGYDSEATLLAAQTSGLAPTNVVVLDADVPGWRAGCSTHSHLDDAERPQAQAEHRDCAHTQMPAWTRDGRALLSMRANQNLTPRPE